MVRKTASIKDNRLVPVDQDSILEMPPNGGGKYKLFQIATFFDKVLGTMAMTYPDDVLLDDWTFIKILGYIVSGGAYQLHATLICLMVGFGPGKGREEGMMDIDYRTAHLLKKVLTENLHVACEYNQFDSLLPDPSELFELGFGFSFLGYRKALEWHSVGFRHRPQVLMI